MSDAIYTAMELGEIADTLRSNSIPEVTLAAAGVMALLIVFLYVKDEDSAKYKLFMILGLFVGAYVAFITVSTYGALAVPTTVIMFLAAFTLIIRPFKDVHFAVLIALLVMGLVYIMLEGLTGTQLEFLLEGWYRIGIAVFCGVMVYSLLHMLESIVKIIGKVLNLWPLLLILGLLCLAEAAMLLTDNGSIYDIIFP